MIITGHDYWPHFFREIKCMDVDIDDTPRSSAYQSMNLAIWLVIYIYIHILVYSHIYIYVCNYLYIYYYHYDILAIII